MLSYAQSVAKSYYRKMLVQYCSKMYTVNKKF